MPNWCNNTVVFEGNDQAIEQIRQLFRIMAEKQEKEEFGQLPDFIKEKQGYFFDLYESDTEIFNYQTRWSPNIEAVQKIAEHYNVDFTMDYEEIGNLIYGRATCENGVLTNIFLEDEDFDLFYYNEQTDCYHFESETYENDCEILEILLERKIENHFNNIKNKMKLSEKPTAFVIIKANTTSGWDTCEFAIIHLSEQWKEEQTKRLELLKPLKGNLCFLSMNYHDTAVDFYGMDENYLPDIDELLADKTWSFVEFDEGELQKLTPPENALNCYQMRVYQRGTAIYSAYGKHTNEEFWTEEFPLEELIKQP